MFLTPNIPLPPAWGGVGRGGVGWGEVGAGGISPGLGPVFLALIPLLSLTVACILPLSLVTRWLGASHFLFLSLSVVL